MRAPEFWRSRSGALPVLLRPVAAVTGAAGWAWRAVASPWRPPVPVVCVGNLVAGGAGKTPTALAVGGYLLARGRKVHFLTRGYGGRAVGPLRVDPRLHRARDVGDEALLLAALAPTWVAHSRSVAAGEALAAGADVLVLDDGLQNPAIAKDVSLLVVDGGYGFGNGLLIPAGPLRETVRSGLRRATAVVLVGADHAGVAARVAGSVRVLRARLAPTPEADSLRGRDVVAFAGIGRPEKFFETLRDIGCRIVARHALPDHHEYREEEIARILDQAAAFNAVPVTTVKDAVRLPPEARAQVEVVQVALAWEDEERLVEVLSPALAPR